MFLEVPFKLSKQRRMYTIKTTNKICWPYAVLETKITDISNDLILELWSITFNSIPE